jgi:hypothetical protein
VSKAARAVPRSGGGCAVPGLSHRAGQRRCRGGKAANRRRPGGGSGSSERSGPVHPSGGCRDKSPDRPPRCGKSSGSCPRTPDSPAYAPCFGQKRALNAGLRGHRGVAGWLRRVVVARRCTQHHLQRVMVETPPRAGPSPPHGPARFSCSAPAARTTDRNRAFRPGWRPAGAAGVGFAPGDRHTGRDRPRPRPGRTPRPVRSVRRG